MVLLRCWTGESLFTTRLPWTGDVTRWDAVGDDFAPFFAVAEAGEDRIRLFGTDDVGEEMLCRRFDAEAAVGVSRRELTPLLWRYTLIAESVVQHSHIYADNGL